MRRQKAAPGNQAVRDRVEGVVSTPPVNSIPHLWPAGHSRLRKSWKSPSFHGCRSWHYDQDCVETKHSVQAGREETVSGRLRRELQCQTGSA